MKKKILICAATKKACEIYSEMLDKNLYEITAAMEPSDIRVMSAELFSVIFILLPFSGESGVRLIDELTEKYDVPVCVIVRADISEPSLKRLLKDDVYILKKPVSRSNLLLAAELLSSFYGKSADMRAKISELEHKNNEIKLMSKAKFALIDANGMTEDEAHRYILHRAMNMQMNIDAVCKEIIEEYG